MRGAAVIYLLAAATVTGPIAHGLQCYDCQSPTPSLQCTKPKNCTSEETSCYIKVYGPGGYPFIENRLVVRGCALECKPSNSNNLGVTRPTFCCQEDLCNFQNGAPGVSLVSWEAIMMGISTSTLLINWG